MPCTSRQNSGGPAGSRDAGLLLAQSEFATGAVETARARLEDLVCIHPDDASLRYEAAAMALDAGHFEAAEAHAHTAPGWLRRTSVPGW